MKLKAEYLPHYAMGTWMLIPTGDAPFQGIVKGNETFGFITQCLLQETSEEELAEKLLAAYDVDREQAARDVHETVERLRGIGAIGD
ncbi:MAG: PqqD family protein [Oscillospiraceae bacterium]|nr:PqqD family protein [Oscillospiraceae bacterium]